MMNRIFFLDPNPSGRPVVLLLHGLGADSASWLFQVPALTQAGFRPLAPDLPGFGRSRYDGRGWSMKRVAAGLADLLDETGIRTTQVVGLSLGGLLAQQLALDFPERVERLVLANTFARLRAGNLSGLAYFIRRALLVHLISLRTQARLVAERVFPSPGQDALRLELVRVITQADGRAYRAAMRAIGLFNVQDRLNELRIPTLVLTGADDTTVPPHLQDDLVKAIPGASQVVIPKAGHAASIDQPERFNQAMIAFLSEGRSA